jgi:SprT protein
MCQPHIKEWIWFACQRNDAEELAQAIIVEWNPRFTRRLGDGIYSPVTFRARIRLSLPLWPRASEKDRRETVIHEACHCIVGYKHGVVAPHGLEWKAAMRNCGVEPLRHHNVDRTGLARRQRLFILLDCPNEGLERKCRIRSKEFNLLRQGKWFVCKVCGLNLSRESAIEEDRREAATVQKL